MITANDILDATNNGLDIILDYYPQARDCVDRKNKHFKMRPDEKTASAVISKSDDGRYKVCDFGGQGQQKGAIDIVMEEDSINFQDAIKKLATRYGVVSKEGKKIINKPIIKRRPRQEGDQMAGQVLYHPYDKIGRTVLKILGPQVTEEHCKKLGWQLAAKVEYFKEDHVLVKESTDTYPILYRTCKYTKDTKQHIFYKQYEPLNSEKQFRFQYQPAGAKPKDFINGLDELAIAYENTNAAEIKSLAAEGDEKKADNYVYQKIPEAIICSGERDALNVKSLGYFPIWFNSETVDITPEQIKHIARYADKIYNIPDIDSTGIRQGEKLALKYVELETIWLPKSLGNSLDRRGNPKKDFRDWMDINKTGKQGFKKLLNLAMPAQFWTESWSEKGKKVKYDIDAECLHYFLRLNGFYALIEEDYPKPRYVRIRGNIVTEVETRDIKAYILNWSRHRGLNRDIRNLIRNSPRLSDSQLDGLANTTLNFCAYTDVAQYYFYKNQTIKVTKDGIETSSKLDRYVWDNAIIKQEFKLLEDFFSITHNDGEWDIKIHDNAPHMLRYMINASRMYWRQEKDIDGEEEKTFDNDSQFRNRHHFEIDHHSLSSEQIHEQKMHLINKIFMIGYLLHHYKSPSKAWAPMVMDNKIGENGECNGRSGKSFLLKSVSNFVPLVKLPGRQAKMMDNAHAFEQLSEHVRVALVDDCDRYLDLGQFYDSITGDVTVNKKNVAQFNIPFEKAPKFAFTTNYVPNEFSPSTNGRMIYVICSDYYHVATEDNDYKESWAISDDFGKDLFNRFDNDEWNLNNNFFMQCLKFYLTTCVDNIKIQPPMDNIIMRKYKQDMGDAFESWAHAYFDEEGENVNNFVPKRIALQAFQEATRQNKWTSQKFTKSLKAFCEYSSYISELNPQSVCNNAGRCQKKIDGVTEECVYVMTKKEDRRIEGHNQPELGQEVEGQLIYGADKPIGQELPL